MRNLTLFLGIIAVYLIGMTLALKYSSTNSKNSSASGGTMAFFKKKAITYDVKGINVRITSYQPTVEQCDSSPFITASGDSIIEESYYRWCAASKDLLYWHVNFGDTIVVDMGRRNPYQDSIMSFIVKDIVSGSKHIDVLCRIGIPIAEMYQGKGKIIGIKRKK